MEALRFIQERDDGDWVVEETGGGETELASRSICRYVQYEIKRRVSAQDRVSKWDCGRDGGEGRESSIRFCRCKV